MFKIHILLFMIQGLLFSAANQPDLSDFKYHLIYIVYIMTHINECCLSILILL